MTLSDQGERRRTVPVRLALLGVRAYQAAAAGRVSPCRFYPSCSAYAAEAFTQHGFGRGLALTARRLLRCRPFGPHGIDLVPLPAAAAQGVVPEVAPVAGGPHGAHGCEVGRC
jgi:putative membrane protein insertion efficiency factor